MKHTNYEELSINDDINFSIIELEKWEKFEITGNKIITVVSWKIKERVKWPLETFESSVYHSWNVIAEEKTILSVFDIKDLDIILNKIDATEKFWDFCRWKWDQLRKLWDIEWFEKFDLYRSKEIFIEEKWQKYWLNLWFCWKEENCWFHNEHNFVEIHTWIVGDWYMQKSEDIQWDKLIETVHLGVWQTHKTFNIEWEFDENWNPIYPIHRYLGWPKWNIWLAVNKYI